MHPRKLILAVLTALIGLSIHAHALTSLDFRVAEAADIKPGVVLYDKSQVNLKESDDINKPVKPGPAPWKVGTVVAVVSKTHFTMKLYKGEKTIMVSFANVPHSYVVPKK